MQENDLYYAHMLYYIERKWIISVGNALYFHCKPKRNIQENYIAIRLFDYYIYIENV
jgi:hypothetical protein